MRYLIRTTKGVLGPFTIESIKSLLQQGKLREDTIILSEADQQRVTVKEALQVLATPRRTTSFYKARTMAVSREESQLNRTDNAGGSPSS